MNFHQISGIGASATLGLTFLANLSYAFGPVADIFPPEVKKWVTMISAGATVILMAAHSATSKSTAVTPPAKTLIPPTILKP